MLTSSLSITHNPCEISCPVNHSPTPTSPNPPSEWSVQVIHRIKRHFFLKMFSVCVLIWVFFVGYFYVLHHPIHPTFKMPLTTLDQLISFNSLAIIPYLSLWIYLGAGPGLLLEYRELVSYGLWIGALCLTGLIFFYLFPTSVPPPEFNTSVHFGFSMLQGVDTTSNACPSMHIATAMFTAIWVEHTLRYLSVPWGPRVLNLAWFMVIAYSTLATKQHVILDVLAGVILGSIFATASIYWRPK